MIDINICHLVTSNPQSEIYVFSNLYRENFFLGDFLYS